MSCLGLVRQMYKQNEHKPPFLFMSFKLCTFKNVFSKTYRKDRLLFADADNE